MIFESVVVEKVSENLASAGWFIVSKCGPTEKGDDIVARRGNKELRIEAKGEGSEKPTSSRYGKLFTRNQVKSHVAVVFYRAAKMRTDNVISGMAFPDNQHHREMVAAIAQSITDLEITIFWVGADGAVTKTGQSAQ